MKVLYGTDGGSPAGHALSLFERVANPEETAVTVVTVVGPGVFEPAGRPADMPGAESSAALVRVAEERLEASGFGVEGKVLQGNPGAAILEEIVEGDYDLTIVGAGNKSRLGRLLLGSVSTKVLHGSPTSVLIVRQSSDRDGRRRVLFGTDGSADAKVALEDIPALLNPTSCDIKVLAVAEHLMPNVGFPIRRAYATAAITPEQEKEWIDAALEPAERSAEVLRTAGFQAEAHAVLGEPVKRLLAEADATEADLVVVGSRGLGAVQRTAIGSVSDQVAREAPATLIARRMNAP
jgi:nucleotide-binding universal stress UspA family protein